MTVVVEKDIIYAEADGARLALDLYRPGTPGPHPVVAYFHGGAWKEGDKSADGDTRLAGLAEHGIAVASINYRLIDQATFPAQVHDAKGAIRWLRTNGDSYGLATESIGVWGASAGGHIAALLALTEGDAAFEGSTGGNADAASSVQAAVDWFGPVDLVSGAHRTWLEEILLAPPLEPPLFGADSIDEVLLAAHGASPLHRVHAQAPPFLISHGDRDRVLPITESAALHDALSRSGVQSNFLVVAGAGHEDHAFDSPANLAITAAFLLTHLRS